MLDARQLRKISVLNHEPLNQAARKILPPEWRDSASLHLLALLRLAIEERVGQFKDPDHGQMEDQLVALEQGDPAWAMEYATTDRGSGDPLLTVEMLTQDREEAMMAALEALHDRIASR